jgi:hypothetical protein
MTRQLVCATAIGVMSLALFTAAAPGQGRQGTPFDSAQGRPATPRAAAPIDLTGTWVSVVTEDWRWRMRTPPKGDFTSLPLTEAAITVANAWDPARDAAAGEQCRGYGAPAVMRLPGRIRVGWENDTTLNVETEAGTQTRLFRFTRPEPAGKPGWQGTSVASWEAPGRRGGAPRGGSLRVTTTNLRPGYLRKNGVPYSAHARLTEYYTVITDATTKDTWLIVTTMVEDPQYLSVPRFVTSSHFKKADGSVWKPTPCKAD